MNKAREIFKTLDETLRSAYRDFRDFGGGDSAELMLLDAWQSARSQLTVAESRGWISTQTTDKLAEYFGLEV